MTEQKQERPKTADQLTDDEMAKVQGGTTLTGGNGTTIETNNFSFGTSTPGGGSTGGSGQTTHSPFVP